MNLAPEFASSEDVRIQKLTSQKGSLMKTKQGSIDLPDNLRETLTPIKVATNNGEEAGNFLRSQHNINSLNWYRMCLALQRTARGIPAVYPSAYTAMEATPESERIYKPADLRMGMIAYSDDPYDSNDAGHVYYIIGRNDNGILTWSNDVKRMGGVDIVYLDFYKTHWGDTFKFGATWLNGYDFSDFNKPAEPAKNYNSLGERYLESIEELKRIRRFKESKPGTERVVRLLTRDITRMEDHYSKFAA